MDTVLRFQRARKEAAGQDLAMVGDGAEEGGGRQGLLGSSTGRAMPEQVIRGRPEDHGTHLGASTATV